MRASMWSNCECLHVCMRVCVCILLSRAFYVHVCLSMISFTLELTLRLVYLPSVVNQSQISSRRTKFNFEALFHGHLRLVIQKHDFLQISERYSARLLKKSCFLESQNERAGDEKQKNKKHIPNGSVHCASARPEHRSIEL